MEKYVHEVNCSKPEHYVSCFDTRYSYDLAIHDEQTTSLWKLCNKIYFLVYSNWWWEFAAHSIWLPTILSVVVVLFMSNILMDHIVRMRQIIFNAYTVACYMTSVLQHGLLLICATILFSSYDNEGSLIKQCISIYIYIYKTG